MEDIENQNLLTEEEKNISKCEKILIFFTSLILMLVLLFFMYLCWVRNEK
jgi:cell division protein FtsL